MNISQHLMINISEDKETGIVYCNRTGCRQVGHYMDDGVHVRLTSYRSGLLEHLSTVSETNQTGSTVLTVNRLIISGNGVQLNSILMPPGNIFPRNDASRNQSSSYAQPAFSGNAVASTSGTSKVTVLKNERVNLPIIGLNVGASNSGVNVATMSNERRSVVQPVFPNNGIKIGAGTTMVLKNERRTTDKPFFTGNISGNVVTQAVTPKNDGRSVSKPVHAESVNNNGDVTRNKNSGKGNTRPDSTMPSVAANSNMVSSNLGNFRADPMLGSNRSSHAVGELNAAVNSSVAAKEVNSIDWEIVNFDQMIEEVLCEENFTNIDMETFGDLPDIQDLN